MGFVGERTRRFDGLAMADPGSDLGTEDSGSNTASKWGRSVLEQSRDYPGRHPGTNAWNLH